MLIIQIPFFRFHTLYVDDFVFSFDFFCHWFSSLVWLILGWLLLGSFNEYTLFLERVKRERDIE